jgi:phosphoribosylglycinamide formyltransferase-1
MIKIGVLISGSGSNLQSIIDAVKRGEIAAEIALVVSNDAAAYGLIRAQNESIPTKIIKHGDYPEHLYEFTKSSIIAGLNTGSLKSAVLPLPENLPSNPLSRLLKNWFINLPNFILLLL